MNEYQRNDEENAQLGKKVAARFSKGKNRLDLIPPALIEELAKVFTYGANKYSPQNWKKGLTWSENVISPMERHLNKWKRGDLNDDESNCHHLMHVIWNAFALWYYEKHKLGSDDRCPYDLDMMNEEERNKRIKFFKECIENNREDEYNAFKINKDEMEIE